MTFRSIPKCTCLLSTGRASTASRFPPQAQALQRRPCRQSVPAVILPPGSVPSRTPVAPCEQVTPHLTPHPVTPHAFLTPREQLEQCHVWTPLGAAPRRCWVCNPLRRGEFTHAQGRSPARVLSRGRLWRHLSMIRFNTVAAPSCTALGICFHTACCKRKNVHGLQNKLPLAVAAVVARCVAPVVRATCICEPSLCAHVSSPDLSSGSVSAHPRVFAHLFSGSHGGENPPRTDNPRAGGTAFEPGRV